MCKDCQGELCTQKCFTYEADGQAMPAEWFLYECGVCGDQTFHTPRGGDLFCSCGPDDPGGTPLRESRWLVTPLYAGNRHRVADLGRRWAKPEAVA